MPLPSNITTITHIIITINNRSHRIRLIGDSRPRPVPGRPVDHHERNSGTVSIPELVEDPKQSGDYRMVVVLVVLWQRQQPRPLERRVVEQVPTFGNDPYF